MMVRLDFTGRAKHAARVMRIDAFAAPGVTFIAQPGPRLPFRDSSIDELFVGRTIMYRDDIAATLDELWRVSKPGALIHLTLPHASSAIAASRDARARPLLTLNTFNYYDPRSRPWDAPTATAFSVERARLRVAGQRGDDSGLALARGPLTRFIEKLANGSRGSQYRFERWFAGLFGGFEEFDVVLSAVKPTQARSIAAVVSTIAANGTAGETTDR
jgi:SAM-dependent methyltransferase